MGRLGCILRQKRLRLSRKVNECKPLRPGQPAPREDLPRAARRPAGAYTRPLFSSTCADSDTKYTLHTPQYPRMPPGHPLNTSSTTPECTPYPTDSAEVELKGGRV